MDGLGTYRRWTEGSIIVPATALNGSSCHLRIGGIEIILDGESGDSPLKGYHTQTDDSLAADFIARYVGCTYELKRLPPRGGSTQVPNGTRTSHLGELYKQN